MNWQDQIISLYLFVCKTFDQRLSAMCERMTNHADLSFTDEEVITVFMFGIIKGSKRLKEIYRYTDDHLRTWFPKLPSYVAFIQRINKLHELFIPMIEIMQTQLPQFFTQESIRLLDSMPIMLAQRSRRFTAKVAREFADNGYCAVKQTNYYGVKLHIIGSYQKGSIPTPEYIGVTPASMHDRKAYEQILPKLSNINLFMDKAYQVGCNPLFTEGNNVQVFTPAKKQKGQALLDAAEQLLSSTVSRIRQPIESFFSWIESTTGIQIASKVRSYNGLMVHIFGRIASAMFIMLTTKFSS